MNRFYRIVLRRPTLTLAVVLIATLYVGSGVRFLETLNNQDSELPKSDPIVRTNDRLKDVFGDKADLLIGIESADVFTPGTLRKVLEISEQLKGCLPNGRSFMKGTERAMRRAVGSGMRERRKTRAAKKRRRRKKSEKAGGRSCCGWRGDSSLHSE